jgi:O-antigen biosynthesis protein
MPKLNPFNHPICFAIPNRLTPVEAWHGHIPYGMYVVDVLKPKMIVELGTYNGDSYCAFCQAVKELQLETRCYAVDTWMGDPQAGFYGREVLAELRAYHDRLYGSFSRLIQSTFDEALAHFSDGSIDILHIDGYHTYEMVMHDFESWLPKVRPGGIILLHDINVLERDYGAHKLWDEIKLKYTHFEFLHSHGMGVLAVGETNSDELRYMFNAEATERAQLRDFFSQLGNRIADKVSVESRDREIQDLKLELVAKDSRIYDLNGNVQVKDSQLKGAAAILEEKDLEIDDLRKSIKTKNDQILVMQSDLVAKSKQLDELKDSSSATNIEIVNIQLEIEEKNFTIVQLRKQLETEYLQKSELNTKLQDYETNSEDGRTKLEDRTVEINELNKSLQAANSQICSLETQLNQIQHGIPMQIRDKYQLIVEKILPQGTRRRSYYQLGVKGTKVILNEGWRSFWLKAKVRIRKSKPLDNDALYRGWISRNEPDLNNLIQHNQESTGFHYRPKISIVIPVWNTDDRWLRAALESVRSQAYDDWELCLADGGSTKPNVKLTLSEYAQKDPRIKLKFLAENKGIAGNTNEALSLASGEFVGFMDHDDELRPDALFEVVKLLNQNPELELIYTDEDKIDSKGRRVSPSFKPDWSPDLFMSMNYISHLTILKRELVEGLGGIRRGFEGSQDYDLLLRVIEQTKKIGHISKPLYSWRMVPESAAARTDAKPYAHISAIKAIEESLLRRKIEGQVVDGQIPIYYRVKYKIIGRPLVSIVIPTKNNLEKLKRCIESIEQKTTYQNYEIIVVDNNSQEQPVIEYLKTVKHNVIKYKAEFNFSRMNNLAVHEAKGEHILFLNNDTEIITPDWLESMLEHSQRGEVGMVGALLLYPSDSAGDAAIQHAGVLLGVGGLANHAFKYKRLSADVTLAKVTRDCSAVTAACAMMRKCLYEEMGGLDESLPVAYNDVDLCLRLRKEGYLIVYTPYSVLYHYEGGTRGQTSPPDDETNALARWSKVISEGDPYYNRNLSVLRDHFSIAPRLSPNMPLAVLMEIYNYRPDLQKLYPEAMQNDHQRLIDWAVTAGVTLDSIRPLLRPFCSWYAKDASDKIRSLAQAIESYNLTPHLQKRFPEVLQGNYRRLLEERILS